MTILMKCSKCNCAEEMVKLLSRVDALERASKIEKPLELHELDFIQRYHYGGFNVYPNRPSVALNEAVKKIVEHLGLTFAFKPSTPATVVLEKAEQKKR